MAEELNDLQFWLPPEFLGDDLFAEEGGKGVGSGGGGGGGDTCLPNESPYGWGYGSDLSSPVESMAGTESSDEEELVAGLALQMSQHSLLQDGGDKGAPSAHGADSSNATSLVGSPQSILSEVWSWNSSSRESSDGPSLVSSPLSSPLEQHKVGAWDTLHADGESDQKLLEQGFLVAPAPKAWPPAQAPVPDGGTTPHPANQPSTQRPLPVNQPQQPKQEQNGKRQGAGAWGPPRKPKGGMGLAGSRPARPLGLSAAAWPPLQQVAGSGMRAVFLTHGSRRESCGTGVFLPRTLGSTTELRKKPGQPPPLSKALFSAQNPLFHQGWFIIPLIYCPFGSNEAALGNHVAPFYFGGTIHGFCSWVLLSCSFIKEQDAWISNSVLSLLLSRLLILLWPSCV
uniref:Uncharacterized protein n=1 Tax=Anthurium amnicola TaxID=1678845 RepID=A0A1D1XIY0_9ARAE